MQTFVNKVRIFTFTDYPEMSDEHIIIASAAVVILGSLTKIKLKKKRQWWQTPLFESRGRYGGSDLVTDLRRIESGQFQNFCRISTDFKMLLCTIGPKICRKDNISRSNICS